MLNGQVFGDDRVAVQKRVQCTKINSFVDEKLSVMSVQDRFSLSAPRQA